MQTSSAADLLLKPPEHLRGYGQRVQQEREGASPFTPLQPLQPPDLSAMTLATAGVAGGKSVFSMFGATYTVPPTFVIPLHSSGAPQYYDEACLGSFGEAGMTPAAERRGGSGAAEGSDWQPLYKQELKRVFREAQEKYKQLLLTLARGPVEAAAPLSSDLELLLVNCQHLLSRLREVEAWNGLADMAERMAGPAGAVAGAGGVASAAGREEKEGMELEGSK